MQKRSDFNKCGVSAVVATVLIIMITVAAVGIIWAVIIPMIKDNMGSSTCNEVDISIVSQGYTCYDATQNVVAVQIKKGASAVDVSGVNFILSSAGNSYSENLSYAFAPNEYHTFYISSLTLGSIEKVSVAPVLKTGLTCGAISLDVLPNCVNLGIVPTINDPYSPVFSNYMDNSNSLLGKGIAWFNVTVMNTNGTVILEINNTNITATNLSSNIYNVSYNFVTNGTYFYRWHSWGNGTSKIYNVSGEKSYFIDVNGVGTVGDPFKILSWEHLNNVRNNLTASYILMNDLNETSVNYSNFNSGAGWLPLGNITNSFSGNFNGNGKTISGLYINRSTEEHIGLFGNMTGNISNVGLVDVDVLGKYRVGGLVGYSSGNISNSYATGNVYSSSGGQIGGLVGQSSGNILNSYTTVNVMQLGSSRVSYFGGLVGYSSGNILNSYATGNVTGYSFVGGLVGVSYATISNSYTTGNIKWGNDVKQKGGLLGTINTSVEIINSYWYNRSQGLNCSGGYSPTNVGCTAKTDVNYFYNYENAPMNLTAGTGWDFTNAWSKVGNGIAYPKLKWES